MSFSLVLHSSSTLISWAFDKSPPLVSSAPPSS